MTVFELQEKLKEFDPSLPVIYYDNVDGLTLLDYVDLDTAKTNSRILSERINLTLAVGENYVRLI